MSVQYRWMFRGHENRDKEHVSGKPKFMDKHTCPIPIPIPLPTIPINPIRFR